MEAQETYYTKEHYPIFVINDGPWDIYMEPKEKYCAAIPTEQAAKEGHLASHFGTVEYVKGVFASRAKSDNEYILSMALINAAIEKVASK